jgi:hypothetical protein
MKSTQYVLSLGNLYRTYQKNLPNPDYDYLNNLIEHYSSKKNLNSEEAKEAENKCKEEWESGDYLEQEKDLEDEDE